VRPSSSWDEEWPVDLDFVNELAAAFLEAGFRYRRAVSRPVAAPHIQVVHHLKRPKFRALLQIPADRSN
jgi:hypothetical protein